ncbi:DUF1796 family putative cysteine peptidase [Methylobacterium sp. Leaf118]|uniref:DUF1796 family putative cysteine peptidase n=1 Tax=Methylobacterium sp. Leaf118 TaxID=2876562 RepID=UPI003FA529D1
MTTVPVARLLKRLRRRLPRRDTREPGAVNHVSLGSHCHMTQILKSLGLRTWSGPFDWIFSCPGMVHDCLADDFAALLDRDQYESTPLPQRRASDETCCRHRLYGERYAIPFVFNHHDPATSERDYRFLQEGVRRLRTALDRPAARNHFYLMTALPLDPGLVPAIHDRLAARCAGSHLTVLQLVPEAGRRAASEIARHGTLAWFRIETLTASVGLRFADPEDDAFVIALLRGQAALPREP